MLEEPNVSEIVCADFDEDAVAHIVASITKGRGVHVDAHKLDSIVAAADGVDLILNGLPLECTQNVLDAALIVKANYQDYAGTTALSQLWLDSDAAKNAADLPVFEDKSTEEVTALTDMSEMALAYENGRLTFEQVDIYFGYAAELGITLETKVKEL